MSLDGGTNLDDGEELDPEAIEATLVYDEYVAKVQAGQPPDTERLLAEHPTLASHLRVLITASNRLSAVAGEMIPEFEDYRIVRVLGRGGMGIVYEAEQISQARRVAVKVLTSTAAMDPQRLRRFLQVEVPAVKLLRHPHIVPILDVGCERGVYFYAMPFINGHNLAQWIKAVSEPTASEGPTNGTASDSGIEGHDGSALPSPSWSSAAPTEPHDPFGNAVRWALQAAEALEFAHRQGVVHRDVKPSNLLLDDQNHVWVTDFGLAHVQGEAHLTATGDLPGTPRYMSPEQIQARRVVDHRTDVYSLGVTLYELLTLRPAFQGDSPQEVMRRVVEQAPKAPRRVNPAIPRDLETVVLKAMARDRDDRYQTARELAGDLRLFLDRKPVQARRLSPLDRASRWGRRHRRAVATAAALLVTAVVGLSVGILWIAQAERRAAAARALAEARARESRYESLMQRLLRLRLTPHVSGWSGAALDLAREAAPLRPSGSGALQAQAAATLIDIDAHRIKEMPAPATSLSFDPAGHRLWMGGSGEKLRTWDETTDRVETRRPAMDGPIAFRADGTPLQLGIAEDARTGLHSLRLWDAGKQTETSFALPDGKAKFQAPALSQAGTYVGAVAESATGQRSLHVWEAASGRTFPTVEFSAIGLTFSPDASLLAAWDKAGQVQLWTLPNAAPLATLPCGTSLIRTVAFGPAPGRITSPSAVGRWLLAVGHAGGTVTLWDLQTRMPMNYCRGSHFDVYALAFSPDGTTLASAGRNHAKLWDVATGRFLLDLKPSNVMTSLAFSPDGSRLAVGSEAAFGYAGGVDVYELEQGRGIRTLRGLTGQVWKTIFSRDGRLIAGLSQDWRVAIWDIASGQLRLLLEVPHGLVADNAGLAFSPDGRRFAFSTGREAKLWDLDTGAELGAWELPEALQDTLAWPAPDQLFLIRMETTDGVPLSEEGMSPRDHPRVMRLRSLLGNGRTELLRVITDFHRRVHHTAATPDGKYLMIEGVGGPNEETRSVNAYDATTGARLWSYPSPRDPMAAAWFLFDPTGKFLCLVADVDLTLLLEMPTRTTIGSLPDGACGLGPGAKLLMGTNFAEPADQDLAYVLHERGRPEPLLRIASNTVGLPIVTPFSPDGRQVAFCNADGSVSVCDLDEIRWNLTEVGLGW